ncbi:MAG: MFS transporter [Anaerolineales bacterium]
MEKSTLTQAVPLEAPPPRRRISARGTFAALQYPNYRLWFYGQMVSLMGTWMQTTAQGYLIYELTKSPVYLGYVGFAAGLPSWMFMLYGGVVADRMSRRNLLIITQASMMMLAFILAGLTFTGLVQPWQIIVLAFLLGVANAFDAPARISFVTELVDRKDLTNAIALNATMFNTATAVGPAVSGLVYAAVGPTLCFVINGASFLAVIYALIRMKIQPHAPLAVRKSALKDIQDGFRYVRSQVVVRTIIFSVLILGLFGLSFITLMPAWAVDVLGGDATTNGYLQSARGIGALTGALVLAAISGTVAKGKLISWGGFIFPGLLMVYSLLNVLPLSLLLLFGIGFWFIFFINTSNALVQSLVPDELRGRVMSIYTLVFFGFMPIGALLAGGAGERIGEQATVFIGALVLLIFAVLVWWRVPSLRRSD